MSESQEGPKCPYCERQYTADESRYYDEIGYTQETCDNCEKTFKVQVNITTNWLCEAIDDEESTQTEQ